MKFGSFGFAQQIDDLARSGFDTVELDLGELTEMDEKKLQEQETEVEIYTLQDEEGNDHEFELIGTCERNGVTYYAMIPVEENEKEDEFCEYVILKGIVENGEESLISIDDDDEFDDIADYFDDLFSEEIDYDAK